MREVWALSREGMGYGGRACAYHLSVLCRQLYITYLLPVWDAYKSVVSVCYAYMTGKGRRRVRESERERDVFVGRSSERYSCL